MLYGSDYTGIGYYPPFAPTNTAYGRNKNGRHSPLAPYTYTPKSHTKECVAGLGILATITAAAILILKRKKTSFSSLKNITTTTTTPQQMYLPGFLPEPKKNFLEKFWDWGWGTTISAKDLTYPYFSDVPIVKQKTKADIFWDKAYESLKDFVKHPITTAKKFSTTDVVNSLLPEKVNIAITKFTNSLPLV